MAMVSNLSSRGAVAPVGVAFDAIDVRSILRGTKRQFTVPAEGRGRLRRIAVGDVIHGLEAWRTGDKSDRVPPSTLLFWAHEAGYVGEGLPFPIRFEADEAVCRWGDNDRGDFGEWGRLRLPQHLPLGAARLVLRVTSVERRPLQSMDLEAVRYEDMSAYHQAVLLATEPGIKAWCRATGLAYRSQDKEFPPTANDLGAFVCRWDRRYRPGQRWRDNPEVLRIGFERLPAGADGMS